MIIDIDLWREELRRLHAEFAQACAQNDAFALERSLYYSALVIRKFSETPFVRRTFLSPVIKTQVFGPAAGSAYGGKWSGRRAQFDLAQGTPGTASLADLCHILIHSQFLQWVPAAGVVKQIFAAGFRAKTEAIGFSPSQYLQLLEHVETHKFRRLRPKPARRAECVASS